MQPVPHEDAERIAQRFHLLYEALAPQHGWQTQQASRTAWEHVPAENRRLMVSVVEELLRAEVIYPGPSLYAAEDAA
jgi:hypothetical protein